MEQDKQLKEILFNSAEGASVDFTDAVMKKVKALSETSLHYQPLVSTKLQKVFVFLFSVVIAAILGLCLIITVSDFHIGAWIQYISSSTLPFNKALLFILIFWIVFAANALFEKKVLFRKASNFKIH